jgi:large subunit ribosomal protein L2
MAIKAYKPTTPARRGMTTQDLSSVTTNKPVRSLLKINKSRAGRNNMGRITTRHRGGGVKRMYRIMNHRLGEGFEGVIEHIEYDPNRSARIARVKDQHGLYHYIIADSTMMIGKAVFLLVPPFTTSSLHQARAAKPFVLPVLVHS